MSRKPMTSTVSSFIFNNITMKGFWMSRWHKENEGSQERKDMINNLTKLIEEKKLVIFMQTHKFSEFNHALATNQKPQGARKVILDLTK
jgi:mitochondrial enoyl-[acyl-carrier protein] reductase / trans-2-enoyl-CoA reductase